MLRARVITALVLLALLAGAAAWSGTALLELLALLVAVAMYEWMKRDEIPARAASGSAALS